MEKNPSFSLETLRANIPSGVDPWLRPDVVAQITGLDSKWLAAAREGRKNLQGPPYVKIGNGRTAPIRYRLSSLIVWMESFEERRSALHRSTTLQGSFEQFMKSNSQTARWLFMVAPDGTDVFEFFEALPQEQIISRWRPRWLTAADYVNRRLHLVKFRLDAESISLLLNIGDGDIAAGVNRLLGK